MSNDIVIDFLGDICLSEREYEKKDLNKLSIVINKKIGNVDYRIADLEAPFISYDICSEIEKLGPNIRMSPEYIDFFRNLNIDGYALANNHIGDYGKEGIESTINALRFVKKDYTGIIKNRNEDYIPIKKEIKGVNFSFFSICENEFGTAKENQIGVAGFNLDKIKKTLKEESKEADYIFIMFHGGTEYYPFPSPEQKLRYKMLIDFGASAVISTHPHCPKGYEFYKGKPIVYGTGNFLYPLDVETPYETWYVGYIARLHLIQGNISMECIPYSFNKKGDKFELIKDNWFNKYIRELSHIIADDNQLRKLFMAWSYMSGSAYFQIMKITVIGDNNKFINVWKNVFSCEAHNELLKTYFDFLYNGYNYDDVKDDIFNIKKYIRISDYIRQSEENEIKEINQREIAVIWGLGKKAENIKEYLHDKEIKFVDRNLLKQGLKYLGIEVFKPEDVIRKFPDAPYYICTNLKNAEEIKLTLLKKGILEKQIFIV